jgi:MFS family permease
MLISSLTSGFLMDKFGRKKIITIKVALCFVTITPMIALALLGDKLKYAVFGAYFLSVFFATFTFDLVLLGFEELPKSNRENYIILISATRIIGIGILCTTFYFLNRWAYFMSIEGGLLALFLILFIKFV